MLPRRLVAALLLVALGMAVIPAPARADERNTEAQLVQSRQALARERAAFPPAYWAVLNAKLTSAEQAWAAFKILAQTQGVPAVISVAGAVATADVGTLGTDGAAAAAGTGEVAVSSVVMPVLAALVLLWPSSTAAPADDHQRDALRKARENVKEKLKDVSVTAERIKSEIEASKKPKKPSTRTPPKPIALPRETECELEQTAGEGTEADPVWCEYICHGFPERIEIVLESGQVDCPGKGKPVKWPQIGGFRRRRP